MLLIINEDHVGQRIDNFLFTHLKGVPKTRIYRMIRKGEVRVDSKRISASFKLQEGQKIRVPPVRISIRTSKEEFNIKKSEAFLAIEKKIEIIDEKNGFLIVNKPEGIAVHGGSGKNFGLIESLRKIKKQPNLQLVHRLDKDTSGIIAIAKTNYAHSFIASQFRDRKVKKEYWGLTWGIWKLKEGEINIPIKRDRKDPTKYKASSNGKKSLTYFKVEKEFEHCSLMRFFPFYPKFPHLDTHNKYVYDISRIVDGLLV